VLQLGRIRQLLDEGADPNWSEAIDHVGATPHRPPPSSSSLPPPSTCATILPYPPHAAATLFCFHGCGYFSCDQATLGERPHSSTPRPIPLSSSLRSLVPFASPYCNATTHCRYTRHPRPSPVALTTSGVSNHPPAAQPLQSYLTTRTTRTISWPQGYTALMQVAFRGHTEALQLLLEHGADPNQGSDQV